MKNVSLALLVMLLVVAQLSSLPVQAMNHGESDFREQIKSKYVERNDRKSDLDERSNRGGVFSMLSTSGSDFVTTPNTAGITIIDYTGAGGAVQIPSEIGGKPVTEIGEEAFILKNLESVEIPKSVTTIGAYAFADNQLTSIEIPMGITTIEEGTFVNNQLTSMQIPTSVTTIGAYTFAENELTSVEIPMDITTIGEGAFAYNELTDVEIPMGITTIEEGTFASNRLKSVQIPKSVTTIGEMAFYENELTSVEIPASVMTIGEMAFAFNQLTSVQIPSGITTIEYGVFANNRLTSVKIPMSVTTIMDVAFYENALQSVTFLGEVVSIDSDAFTDQISTNNTFNGWYEDKAFTIRWGNVITQPMTIYAQWDNYTLSFESNDGSAVVDLLVLYNTTTTEPAVPTKVGHTFVSWYKDPAFTTVWDFTKDVVTENTTLYAKWDVINYTLSFASNGGSAVADRDVPYSTTTTQPMPTKAGYTFAGWYKDAALTTAWDFTKDVVTETTTLYAKWTLNSTSGGSGGGYVPTPEPSPIPESKPESKPELKPEPKPEAKPEPTPEPKPEPKSEQKPELKPEPTPIHFSDIASDHWAADFIYQAAAMGIFKGYDNGNFGPNDNLTRAQSISILVRMLGVEPSNTSSFTDIQGYAKETQAEINAAFQFGLVKGQNGKFHPTSEITRAQFALILYRGYEMLTGEAYIPVQIAPFGDIDKYDEETKNAISMLHELGIADGSEGNFMPGKPITRAQAAKILVNTVKILEQLNSSN